MKTNIYLGHHSKSINDKIAQANEENLIKRIWDKDYTIWSESPAEITNRLGWLDISVRMEKVLGKIYDFVEDVKAEFDTALLLGMGGSSLAPDVFSNIFGEEEGSLKLKVLDSTHPDFVNRIAESIDFSKTLFIVSTKSGGTAETMSLMKFFYNKCKNLLGEKAGSHFIAITDPGSGLEQLANELEFRNTFLNDPNIGGRFSALSYFGLVPAALLGIDLNKLLQKTNSIICPPDQPDCLDAAKNEPAAVGITMGELALNGKNKLTFLTSRSLANFGDWVEQLIAESTGKIGKGILPVVGEEEKLFNYFGDDRVIVFIHLQSYQAFNSEIERFRSSGYVVIDQVLEDIYDLGALIYFWEFATAVSGWVMKLQPFDQPNVESAKVAARQLMAEYSKTGQLPPLSFNYEDDQLKINSTLGGDNLESIVEKFLSKIRELNNPYLSLHCYSDYDSHISKSLNQLRLKVTEKFEIPVTIGYGPRFLHSTGQLHKGDDGSGLFIQFFVEPSAHIDIPDNPGSDESSISFNVLVRAQSLGDRKALIDNKRNVLRIEAKDIIPVINNISDLI